MPRHPGVVGLLGLVGVAANAAYRFDVPDYVPRLEALAEQNQSNERNFAILKSLYHYLEDL